MTYHIAVKWPAPEMVITAEPAAGYELSVMLFDADASVAVLCKGGGHRAVATAQISGCNEYGLKFAIHSAAGEAIAASCCICATTDASPAAISTGIPPVVVNAVARFFSASDVVLSMSATA